ncbi:hypothetical protein [Streptomyces atriruber]|nr:hypothetical protein [Streptomyces atriruber]
MRPLRILMHRVFPALHWWAEAAGGPLRWICTGCGAQTYELP